MSEWAIGPRVARYRAIGANDDERQALEAIGHTEFEAISIGRGPSGPQIAIVPLDESSRQIAAHIVSLHNSWRLGPDAVPDAYHTAIGEQLDKLAALIGLHRRIVETDALLRQRCVNEILCRSAGNEALK